MTNALHAPRLPIAFVAALMMVACSQSQVESTDHSAGDAGHASGEHGSGSSAGLPTGRADVGNELAHAKGKATGQSCVDCHGTDGNAPVDPSYPKLGGQYGDYLAHALQAYRSGDRQHPLMTAQATALSDRDIADLAAYFGARHTQLRDLHGVN